MALAWAPLLLLPLPLADELLGDGADNGGADEAMAADEDVGSLADQDWEGGVGASCMRGGPAKGGGGDGLGRAAVRGGGLVDDQGRHG